MIVFQPTEADAAAYSSSDSNGEADCYSPNPQLVWDEATEACLNRLSPDAQRALLGPRKYPKVYRCAQEIIRHWAEQAR
jgi:hypothetical protein